MVADPVPAHGSPQHEHPGSDRRALVPHRALAEQLLAKFAGARVLFMSGYDERQVVQRYVVEKGSIAVEGISLTVAGVEGDEVWIAILPHTYRATNLHTLRVGAGVNIEVDVLAKYAEGRERAEGWELTAEYLLANGY